MIVKVSVWSLAFFERWWNAFDRSHGMDQHVLAVLWERNEMDLQSHMAILSPEAFNSRFPAYLYQQDSDPVLHLAGESSITRRVVFQEAFLTLCRSRSSGGIPPQQLGLDRVSLQRLSDCPPLLDECLSTEAIMTSSLDPPQVSQQQQQSSPDDDAVVLVCSGGES